MQSRSGGLASVEQQIKRVDSKFYLMSGQNAGVPTVYYNTISWVENLIKGCLVSDKFTAKYPVQITTLKNAYVTDRMLAMAYKVQFQKRNLATYATI